MTLTQEAFEVLGRDIDCVAKVAQSRLFKGDHVFADFALHRVGQPVEHDLFGHAPDEFRPQLLTDTREHRALDGGEGSRLHAHGFGRANVAREDDVEAAQVFALTGREGDRGVIQNLEKQVQHERVRSDQLFDGALILIL
jgi:hypothetical protein